MKPLMQAMGWLHQVVALVGPSGGGKSSIVKLVERFYLPAGGAVHIDGRDVGIYDEKWLRRRVAIVSQEPVLYGRRSPLLLLMLHSLSPLNLCILLVHQPPRAFLFGSCSIGASIDKHELWAILLSAACSKILSDTCCKRHKCRAFVSWLQRLYSCATPTQPEV